MNLAKSNKAALLCLGLSVLLGTAQAQTVQTPTTQVQPGIPATPLPAAAPAAPSSAPLGNAAPLRLQAAPGTALEYVTTRQVQVRAFSLRVVARPGAVLSADDVTRVAGLNTTLGAETATLQRAISRGQPAAVGKQFLKVLPPDTQGNTVLLSTSLAAPLSLGRSAPAQAIRLTQTAAPDGTTLAAQIAADDPATQRFYDALLPEQRLSSFGQNAQASLLGLDLAPGASATLVQALDLSGLLGDLAAALGGAGVADQIRLQPLLIEVGTTFLGRSAAGGLSYQQRFAARPWSLSTLGVGAGAGEQPGVLRLSVSNWNGQGGVSFRPGGLPQTADSSQSAEFDLVLDVPGVPAQLQAHLEVILISSSAVR